MAEKRVALNAVLVLAGFALAGYLLLRLASSGGVFPFTSADARTPRDLLAFLESDTAHVKGVKVNGHHLEIGKRPSLQILRGYGRVMYQVRPYRQVNFKYRNFTGAEIVDFCTHITGAAFDGLRGDTESGRGPTPAWKGKLQGRETAVIPVTRFTYFVTGLAEKPFFMGQVELAKRLGMNDAMVLHSVIPAQDRWLETFRTGTAPDASYPGPFPGEEKEKDELVAWLGGSSRQD